MLHVVNGDSTAGCFRSANPGLRDRVLVHRGLLSWGPLRPLDDVGAWFETRRRFFAAVDPDCVLLGLHHSDIAANLVSRPRDSQHNSRAGHPAWLRCSSLTYAQ
jgi:hypothetical protein